VLLVILLQLFNFSSAQVFHAGVNVGTSNSSGPYGGKDSALSYGGRIGWLFYEHVSFGAVAHFYQANEVTESIGYFPLLAEVSFYPYGSPLEKSVVFVSGLFGTTKIVYDLGNTEGTNNQTTFGVAAGYSFFLEPRYSMGPELQYLFIFDDQAYAMWSFLLTLRMWF
jgi:hypothetical protein